MRAFELAVLSVAAVMASSACAGDAAVAPGTEESLTLEPRGSVTLYTGRTQQIAVTARDGSGSVIPEPGIVWSSSNEEVAAVGSTGLITARTTGTALITAVSVCCSESSLEVVVRDPPSEVEFSSDWSTATGSSSSAILDANSSPPWSSWRAAGGLPLVSVVPATALGFPSANALRVNVDGSQSSDVRAVDLWPAPAPGQSLYFRMYARFDIPNGYGNLSAASHHPIQPEPGSCPSNWAFNIGSFQDGTLDLIWAFSASSAGFGMARVLNKFQTYRWEWAFHRQQNGTYKADIRIYDMAGTLVADADDFISRYSPDYTTPLSTMNPNVVITDACIRRLMVGSNGPQWPSMSDAFTYYGAVAVRLSNSSTDWIGAY